MHECNKTARVGVERTSRRKRKKLDRLTRDAIAAQEAGMSYGKWKALHPHTPDEDDEKEQELDTDKEVAVCEYCGERFVKFKWQKTRRFCGAICQNKSNHEKRQREKKRTQPGKPAVCPICGADFMADYQHRIYCSSECYAESQRRKSNERNAAKRLETDLDMATVACEYCGERFTKSAHQTRKRFCNNTCKNRYNAAKQHEKARQEKTDRTATCAVCGAIFTPANGNSKYCSECQVEVHRQKNREWYASKKEKEAAENGSV